MIHGNKSSPREERRIEEIHPHLDPCLPIQIFNSLGSPIQESGILANILPGAARRLEYAAESIQAYQYLAVELCNDEKQAANQGLKRRNKQVEYDMDSMDRQWLHMLDQELEIGQKSPTRSQFELVMDRFERGWNELVAPFVALENEFPVSEKVSCAICGDQDATVVDTIVLCDRCDLAVHQECYGIPAVPEGAWYCFQCAWAPGLDIRCILCSYGNGGLKLSEEGEWVHVSCAYWIEEVGFSNYTYMEPITGIRQLSKSRWGLLCQLCGDIEGVTVCCSHSNCRFVFHVSCGLRGCLYRNRPKRRMYCPQHTPQQYLDRLCGIDLDLLEQNDDYVIREYFTSSPTKDPEFRVSRALPVIPECIVRRVMRESGESLETLYKIAKYWAVRRRMNGGAPLIDRLKYGEEEDLDDNKLKEMMVSKQRWRRKLAELNQIMITAQELETHRQMRTVNSMNMYKLWKQPFHYEMGATLTKLHDWDTGHVFWNPVDEALAPYYYDIIKSPMAFSMMRTKLNTNQYFSLDQVRSDFLQVCSNAMTYNQRNTIYFKLGQRLRRFGIRLFERLAKQLQAREIGGQDDSLSLPLLSVVK